MEKTVEKPTLPTSVDTRKQAVWPLIAGILTPLIVVGIGLAFVVNQQSQRAGQQSDAEQAAGPPAPEQQLYANISVSLQDQAGNPISDRKVTFLLRDEQGSDGRSIPSRTDTAGFATVSIPKEGSVFVDIAGTDSDQEITNLGPSRKTDFHVTVVLDQ